MLYRLLAGFMLLLVAFGANADDSCWSLYSKSGATPGTPMCRLDVASNTPSGMGSYGCRNDIPESQTVLRLRQAFKPISSRGPFHVESGLITVI